MAILKQLEKCISIVFAISFICLVIANVASAQINADGSITQQIIRADYSPKFPGVNEDVQIELVSYDENLAGLNIAWFINGKLVKQGRGIKNFTFATGNLGDVTIVDVAVNSDNFGIQREKLIFRPAEVDLHWQAKTYTPPFYKGKALSTNQSEVTVYAIPHIILPSGEKLRAGDLDYRWKKNEIYESKNSGIGKSSYTFNKISMMRGGAILNVEVSDKTGAYTAFERIFIIPTPTVLVAYAYDPFEGLLLNKAVRGDYIMKSNEATFVVIPFFTGAPTISDESIKYKWMMNGSIVKDNQSNVITFSLDEQFAGSSRISYEMNRPGYYFEYGKGTFNIIYGDIESII